MGIKSFMDHSYFKHSWIFNINQVGKNMKKKKNNYLIENDLFSKDVVVRIFFKNKKNPINFSLITQTKIKFQDINDKIEKIIIKDL